MSRIPIEVQKITGTVTAGRNALQTTSGVQFQLAIREKGTRWQQTFICSIKELTAFRDELTSLLDSSSTAERLSITPAQGEQLDALFATDEICRHCPFTKSQHCVECVFKLESPLERMLFVELRKAGVWFTSQYALDWNGEKISMEGRTYDHPTHNFREVLTVADFYLRSGATKLCVYTDGHTYHERSEEQAQRDKRIDRKLQEHGYRVLRYTGKDIRENLTGVVTEIRSWLN